MSVGWKSTALTTYTQDSAGLISFQPQSGLTDAVHAVGCAGGGAGRMWTATGNGHIECSFTSVADLVTGGPIAGLSVFSSSPAVGSIKVSLSDANGAPIQTYTFLLKNNMDHLALFNTVLLDPNIYNPALAQYASILVELSVSGKMGNPTSADWNASAPNC